MGRSRAAPSPGSLGGMDATRPALSAVPSSGVSRLPRIGAAALAIVLALAIVVALAAAVGLGTTTAGAHTAQTSTPSLPDPAQEIPPVGADTGGSPTEPAPADQPPASTSEGT